MTRWRPDLATLAAGFAVVAVLAARALVADAQLDWDEELYFQIARNWSGDFLPYRDLFDHKPAFLYAYIAALTGGGESLAALRLVQAVILLGAILWLVRSLWEREAGRVDPLMVPFLFALLSLPPTLGTNSEILFIPFVLGMVAAALGGRLWLAAVCAAIAVSLNYAAVLDLLGAFGFFLAVRGAGRFPWGAVLGAVALFGAIQLCLYLWFRAEGVDLIAETVLRNLVHAADRGAFHLPKLFLAGAALPLGLIALRLAVQGRYMPARPAAALVLWAALAFLHATVTGQYYFHYFIPVFVPLAIMVFSGPPVAFRAGIGALFIALGIGVLATAAVKLAAEQSRQEALAALCTEGSFHYHGDYLAIYRRCDGPPPLRFMYPRFYAAPHFALVSESGGRDWACAIARPVIVDQGGAVSRYADGADWCARGEVAPVTGVNSNPVKQLLDMLGNGEAGG
ncbi:hypothetical protein KHP62_06995 [Rhodobacteraceae bacterium NNCM2]|nr:hypothetical protein [Coraliihabitans acroporae]